jgi:hypothetical protein
MKRVLMLVCAFGFVNSAVFADICIDNGQHAIVNYSIYGDSIMVDSQSPNGYSSLEFADGAYLDQMSSIFAYNNSTVKFSGGYAETVNLFNNSHFIMTGGNPENVYLNDNVSADISGGWTRLVAHSNNQVLMTGGYLYEACALFGNSVLDVKGGHIIDGITLKNNAVLTLYGDDFNYGFGTLINTTGQLTGILQDGSSVNFTFYLNDNSQLNLVATPEPTTMLLFGFGGLFLRKQPFLKYR